MGQADFVPIQDTTSATATPAAVDNTFCDLPKPAKSFVLLRWSISRMIMSTLRGRVKFLDNRDGFEGFLDGRDVKNIADRGSEA
jgi:hypothetical protein